MEILHSDRYPDAACGMLGLGYEFLTGEVA